MSLQIWLPFNGNAENHGLYNVTPTSTAWSSNRSGKIGLCAKLSTSSNFNTLLPISAWDYSEKSISFSLWVKINQAELNAITSSKSYTSTYTTAGGTLIGRHSYKGLAVRWKTNNIYTSGSLSQVVVYIAARDNAGHSYATTVTNVSWDTWVHVVGVFNRNLSRLELYINGQLTYTSAINVSYFTSEALQNSNVFLNVAEWDGGIGHGVSAPWYVNDVRVYDHALSEKEVKELAKGLVLHYKLDDGYVEGTTNLCAGLVAGGRTIVSNNTVRNTGENADTYWYIKPKEATVGNAIYTLSCDLSGFSTDSKYIQWGVVSQNSGLNWKTYNGHNEFTFTMPASRNGSTANIILDDNDGNRAQVFKISNVQLEKKDHATPYVGGPGLTRTPETVFDSSGFKYNGTPVNIVISKDTARYSNSFMFNGSSSYIKTESKDWMISGSTELTINFWAKTSNWTSGRMISCTESGGFNIEPGNSGYLRFPVNAYTNADKTSHAYIYDSSELQISAMPVNQWAMITCVYNAATGTKTYINGVLHHTYSRVTYGLYYYPYTRLFLGCEASSVSPSGPYFNGFISDFRMYYTELSANDILELYQTSASIDKNGNVYARELVEE